MRQAFVDTLSQLMKKDKKLITMTADMGFSVFENLQKEQPDRFINSGVTEQASVGMAAGLSLTGFKVFLYAQAIFITGRCFEQVRLDVAYGNADVKLVGTAAGFSLNQLGISHFALEDVALMRILPNMTIFTPGDPLETEWAVKKAYELKGPCYIRITKNGSEKIHSNELDIKIGEIIKLTEGKMGTLFVSGGLLTVAKKVSEILEKKNHPISLFSVPTINPIDKNTIIKEIKKSKNVYTLEEHFVEGGLASVIAEIIAYNGLETKLHSFGIPKKYISITGSMEYLLDKECGLTPEKISQIIIQKINK